jgi:hypothetical protein
MRTWAVAAALLMAAATAAGSLYVCGYRRGLTDAYVARSVALTESFASVVGSWLAFGYRSSLDVLADILLETEAAGLQFLTQSGPAYERCATGDWAPLDIADWTASARLRGGHLFGASAIEVIAPLAITDEDPPYGCVRIVYSTDPLNDSVRARVGVVAAAWAAFAGCVGLGLRFITHRSEKAGAANRHSLLQVDLASRRVIVRGQSIDLPPKLFGLLACLAEEPGRVHSDAEILRSVWPESAYADSKDVKQCVYMLRHRLGDVLDDPERVIVNVKGYGYRLDVSQV